jgi:hypothetical protein
LFRVKLSGTVWACFGLIACEPAQATQCGALVSDAATPAPSPSAAVSQPRFRGLDFRNPWSVGTETFTPEGTTQFCSLRCGSAVPSELAFNIRVTGDQWLVASDKAGALPRALSAAEQTEYAHLRTLPGVVSVISRFAAGGGYACPSPVDERYNSQLILVDDTGARRVVANALGCLTFGPSSADPEVRDLGELLSWLLRLSRELAQCETAAPALAPNTEGDAAVDGGEAPLPRGLCHYNREGE